MEKAHPMRKSAVLTHVALCVLMLTLSGTALAQSGPATQPANESFSWPAELVALDEAARVLTVKAMVLGDRPVSEFTSFRSGDKIVLTWSGVTTSADAISRAVKYEANRQYETQFTFPAEFVAFDADKRMLTFKAPVPADSLASLKTLRPGEWVTATSSHRVSSENQALLSARPWLGSNAPASSSSD